MSVYKALGFGVFVSLLFVQTSGAQESKEKSNKQSEKYVERIEVVGQKPRRLLLNEYKRHQRDFISSFNDLVDDKQMQVVCKLEQYRKLSRVRKKNCQPRFIKTILSKATQRDFNRDITFLDTNVSNDLVVQSERPQAQKVLIEEYIRFQKLTVDILNKNPELAATYIKMEDTLAQYQNYKKN